MGKENDLIKRAVTFAHLLIWEYDPINHTFYDDNGWIKEMGLEECIYNVPQSLFDANIIAEESKDAYQKMFEDIENGMDDVTCEAWIYEQKGMRKKCVRINYQVERDESGKAIICHGISQDITELRNAEDAYNVRINSVFRMNPDAVSRFSFNISKNWCGEGKSYYANIEKLQDKGTIDGFIEDAMEFIQDKNEQRKFRHTFDKKRLIDSFENGITRIDLDHHYLLEPGRDEWVRSSMELIKNPVTGDLECGFYTINMHRIKVVDTMFRSVAQREYDLIAAIYTDTGDYMIMDHKNKYVLEKKNDYEGHQLKRMNDVICDDESKDAVLKKFDWKHILEEVDQKGDFILTFSAYDEKHNLHRKKLRYSYVDKARHILLMTCRDITDLYLAERKQEEALQYALANAEQASQAKSEFLSRVSHDIRTPLNGITGMLQLAKLESNLDKIYEYIDQASLSSDFLLGLINDILDMSKIESGKVELQPENYEFSEFKEYLDVVIRPLCEKRDLEFSAQAEIASTIIKVDKLRFNQIFFNLLSNSAKYTLPGGKVSFSCDNYRVHDGKVRIDFYVRDNGIGMSKEFQTQLFQTFTQENRDIVRGTQGTGLGLAITQNLIQLMGGTISVNSKINQGTEFKVTLEFPLVDESERSTFEHEKLESKMKKSKEEYDFHGLRVLLCEDNKINQEIAIRLLEWAGAEVEVAGDGKEAVEFFAESKIGEYGIILMDIRMPIMDGLTATRQIRALDRVDAKSVPIVAMTANALSDEKDACFKAGMNAHLMKPIVMEVMYHTIESVIKH